MRHACALSLCLSFKTALLIAATAATMATIASNAHAEYVAIAEEIGGDVVITGSGSLDLTSWNYLGDVGSSSHALSANVINLGPNGSGLAVYNNPVNLTGPSMLKAAMSFGSFGSGDIVAWAPSSDFMFVPGGYVSGDPLESSTTFLGQSFASMGITSGDTYTWTWETESGGIDSYTFMVGIPAPGALALFAVAGIAPRRRRRD